MTDLIPFLAPAGFVLAFVVALVAGTIKGLVGFAMPMIMVSGLSSIMAPDLALAGLILPTLVTNGFQALKQGPGCGLGVDQALSGLFAGGRAVSHDERADGTGIACAGDAVDYWRTDHALCDDATIG